MRHRCATDHDVEALHALYSSPEVAPNMGFDPMPIEAFGQVLASWRGLGEVRVVEDEAGLVASYRLERRERRMRGVVYLASFAVAPHRSGQGLGSRTLSDLIAELRAEGVRRIELLVASDNPKAAGLFRRHGFEHEGTLRAYFRRAGAEAFVDEYAMALLLDGRSPGVPSARASHRGVADHYAWGQGCDGWRLVASSGLSVIEERMPPGSSETRHYHAVSRQFFYVLRGELVVECGSERWEIGERHGLELPPGVVHQVRNEGAVDAEFLVVSQPPSHGDRHTPRS